MAPALKFIWCIQDSDFGSGTQKKHMQFHRPGYGSAILQFVEKIIFAKPEKAQLLIPEAKFSYAIDQIVGLDLLDTNQTTIIKLCLQISCYNQPHRLHYPYLKKK